MARIDIPLEEYNGMKTELIEAQKENSKLREQLMESKSILFTIKEMIYVLNQTRKFKIFLNWKFIKEEMKIALEDIDKILKK